MSATHRATLSVNRGVGLSLSRQSVITSENDNSIPALVCPEDAATEISFVAPIAAIKSLLIYADGVMALKTNSSGAPAQTFNLTASNYLFWNTDSLLPNPITTGITKLFAVVPAGDDVTLWVIALLDVTP